MAEEGLRILIIDDEKAIRKFLRTALQVHGHQVFEAPDGRDGLATIVKARPDVILLDLGLPDIDGIEIIHNLREWTTTPIIVLSVRDQDLVKVEALDAGADDYLEKPFSMAELMARIRVAMRHTSHTELEPIHRIGNLVIDFSKRKVSFGDQVLSLTPTEYDLLRALVLDAGKVLTHRHLLYHVWGAGYENETHILRVNISNLRHKIEPNPSRPQLIITEPGVGYRLRED